MVLQTLGSYSTSSEDLDLDKNIAPSTLKNELVLGFSEE